MTEQPRTDEYDQEWEPVHEDALPPRPRRRFVTPVTAVLATVIVAALGFFGGVQVQKHSQGSTASATAGGGRAALAAAFARRGGFGAAAGSTTGGGTPDSASTPTTGTVAYKHGSTLYVTVTSGTTVRVRTSSAATTITRNASTSAGAIHPGDTVVVVGAKATNGAITATTIRATAKGVSAGGGFGGGGGFGAGGAAGGAPGGG